MEMKICLSTRLSTERIFLDSFCAFPKTSLISQKTESISLSKRYSWLDILIDSLCCAWVVVVVVVETEFRNTWIDP